MGSRAAAAGHCGTKSSAGAARSGVAAGEGPARTRLNTAAAARPRGSEPSPPTPDLAWELDSLGSMWLDSS